MPFFKQRELNYSPRQMIILGLLGLGVVSIIFPFDSFWFRKWSSYAPQIAIGYWLLGILFLVLKRTNLTIATFVLCAFLCIYLKSNTNQDEVVSLNASQPMLTIAHFNLSSSNSGYLETIDKILASKADVVSIQEVTPDWHDAVISTLKKEYPYVCSVVGNDLFSLELFSKYPYSQCDTFYCDNAPNILVRYDSIIPNEKVNILSTYIAPPLFASAIQLMRAQLDTISERISHLHDPLITIGEYNINPTSNDIVNFRNVSKLQDSRRGYRPTRNDGYLSFFEVPTDHIFFSNHFNCLEFQTINGPQSEHLGILGKYQIKADSLVILEANRQIK